MNYSLTDIDSQNMKTFLSTLILKILILTIRRDIAVVGKPTTSIFLKPGVETVSDIQATIPRAIEESTVPGVGFNRIFQIWLENVNFETAAGNKDMRWLAEHGVLLENYYAVTHPSQPNYVAAVGGDTFGLQNDRYHRIPANVSTVIELLDTKQISWAEYQENFSYSGVQGANGDGYVSKHNPLSSYDIISRNATRMARIKNFTSFEKDLAGRNLPQWAFFTPNIRDDGHDTGLAFAGRWLHKWLGPLMENEYFMNRTLIVVTFDEAKQDDIPNKVFTVLLGGAIHPSLHGTTDSMYYNHYSMLSTISVNWDLPSLGRWDCDANVFSVLANKVGYKNTDISYQGLSWSESYPGPLNDVQELPGWWPKPDTEAKCAAGRGVLGSVKSLWGRSGGPTKGCIPAVGVNDASSSISPCNAVPSQTGSAGRSKNSGSLTKTVPMSLTPLLLGIAIAALS
ncbi:phosphoesterase family-domain-containing protein [Fusarium redolens]|uniref:Phosphoesterase family-domain-containing protein n=1 Tax=Fusarium redolens TaxID=48865 RepID=A0A9P9HY47_FUSRE|nr:phosphoesterase family-domain-containing protein [Fusarium redolens]KAH7265735.1 phosphoesterase family-domain-containing protein [Fusarium redolens]